MEADKSAFFELCREVRIGSAAGRVRLAEGDRDKAVESLHVFANQADGLAAQIEQARKAADKLRHYPGCARGACWCGVSQLRAILNADDHGDTTR